MALLKLQVLRETKKTVPYLMLTADSSSVNTSVQDDVVSAWNELNLTENGKILSYLLFFYNFHVLGFNFGHKSSMHMCPTDTKLGIQTQYDSYAEWLYSLLEDKDVDTFVHSNFLQQFILHHLDNYSFNMSISTYHPSYKEFKKKAFTKDNWGGFADSFEVDVNLMYEEDKSTPFAFLKTNEEEIPLGLGKTEKRAYVIPCITIENEKGQTQTYMCVSNNESNPLLPFNATNEGKITYVRCKELGNSTLNMNYYPDGVDMKELRNNWSSFLKVEQTQATEEEQKELDAFHNSVKSSVEAKVAEEVKGKPELNNPKVLNGLTEIIEKRYKKATNKFRIYSYTIKGIGNLQQLQQQIIDEVVNGVLYDLRAANNVQLSKREEKAQKNFYERVLRKVRSQHSELESSPIEPSVLESRFPSYFNNALETLGISVEQLMGKSEEELQQLTQQVVEQLNNDGLFEAEDKLGLQEEREEEREEVGGEVTQETNSRELTEEELTEALKERVEKIQADPRYKEYMTEYQKSASNIVLDNNAVRRVNSFFLSFKSIVEKEWAKLNLPIESPTTLLVADFKDYFTGSLFANGITLDNLATQTEEQKDQTAQKILEYMRNDGLFELGTYKPQLSEEQQKALDSFSKSMLRRVTLEFQERSNSDEVTIPTTYPDYYDAALRSLGITVDQLMNQTPKALSALRTKVLEKLDEDGLFDDNGDKI